MQLLKKYCLYLKQICDCIFFYYTRRHYIYACVDVDVIFCKRTHCKDIGTIDVTLIMFV